MAFDGSQRVFITELLLNFTLDYSSTSASIHIPHPSFLSRHFAALQRAPGRTSKHTHHPEPLLSRLSLNVSRIPNGKLFIYPSHQVLILRGYKVDFHFTYAEQVIDVVEVEEVISWKSGL